MEPTVNEDSPVNGTLDIAERLERQRGREARSESVATRFTRAEERTLAKAAAEQGLTLREWAREVLLREARSGTSDALLTEVVAMRMMLNSFLRPLCCGETITPEDFTAQVMNIRATKQKVTQEIVQQYAAAAGKEE